MNFKIQTNTTNINWSSVTSLIKEAGLSSKTIELTQKSFQNSYAKVFIFEKNTLIGVGRAISDGVSESAIYDIAVLPEYQGYGIGKMIMNTLQDKLQGTNIILYARPGIEPFYHNLNYSKMKTGMAKFVDIEAKRKKGFIE